MLDTFTCLLNSVSAVNVPNLVTSGARRRGLFSSAAIIDSRCCFVPGRGADGLKAIDVMDLAELNLSPKGWNEMAVAESFCSVFGFTEVETKGS
jgi:hypothetical protein